MESITFIAASWASGINAYLTVLILGVAGRLDLADTPVELQRTWVLGLAAMMFMIEFVADKVPLVDSAWDAVHTFIRPVVGGVIGALIAGADLGDPVAFAGAFGLALVGHGTKATSRLAINTSPEPVTNMVASFLEDGVVAGLVTLALAYPKTSAVVALILAAIGVVVAIVLLRVARAGWRRMRRRFSNEHNLRC